MGWCEIQRQYLRIVKQRGMQKIFSTALFNLKDFCSLHFTSVSTLNFFAHFHKEDITQLSGLETFYLSFDLPPNVKQNKRNKNLQKYKRILLIFPLRGEFVSDVNKFLLTLIKVLRFCLKIYKK